MQEKGIWEFAVAFLTEAELGGGEGTLEREMLLDPRFNRGDSGG